jgi:filamentous hemagglutinin
MAVLRLAHNTYGARVQGPQGEPAPYGFSSYDEFLDFRRRLRRGVPEGTQPLFQGSAVTGRSFRTGKPFDVGRRSDFDIALAGPELFGKAKDLGLRAKDGTRIGPLMGQSLQDLGLLSLTNELGAIAQRPVRFMLFDSIPCALKRPSIWVPEL